MSNAVKKEEAILAQSQSEKLDIKRLMDEIRQKVKTDIASHASKSPKFSPYSADGDLRASAKAGELRDSEELRFLNQNYAYSFSARRGIEEISSHRWGPLGKIIVKFKRKFASMIWDGILQRYFEEEREFQSRLVRYLNHVSKYVDARDASNFWELIRKIDYDVQKALDRIERASDEHGATLRSTERDIISRIDAASLEQVKFRESLAEVNAKLKVLESVASGLESIVSRASMNAPSQSDGKQAPIFKGEQSYLLLENRFRGSEQEITERLRIYPDVFKSIPSKLPVMEIGGGRGELQLLFKSAGVESFSIDIDEAMVTQAKEKGVDARLGDGLEFLRQAKDCSLGGVIAVQVVEHLNWDSLRELFELCRRKVSKGGKVVFETINPRSMVALSSNYFRDPTHVWPLHPDTLSYQMSLSGLKICEVRNLSPVPEEAGISTLEMKSFMSPRWAEFLDSINRNFKRLHELLYGYQDYCVIAEV